MTDENKEQWLKLLKDFNFKHDFDKALKYIETHIEYDNQNSQTTETVLDTTIVLAISVLNKLSSLDNVHFLSEPSENGVDVVENTYHIRFQRDELSIMSDPKMYMEQQLINILVEIIEGIISTKDIYIYLLFNEIKTVDTTLHVTSRYAIS
jgi:U3 small nucleolar ribonucleoprotein component